MKKLLIVIALAMCCCKQQTSECPYTFMGIPLDMTTDEFNQKLIEKGFSKDDNETFTGFFFGYNCTVSGASDLFNTKPGLVRMALVQIGDYVFDDIKEALMEKYSDTAKWRIDDDNADYAGDWTSRDFSIYSTDDDVNSYIRMTCLPFLKQTMIMYCNVDYYKDTDKIKSEQMQDL